MYSKTCNKSNKLSHFYVVEIIVPHIHFHASCTYQISVFSRTYIMYVQQSGKFHYIKHISFYDNITLQGSHILDKIFFHDLSMTIS